MELAISSGPFSIKCPNLELNHSYLPFNISCFRRDSCSRRRYLPIINCSGEDLVHNESVSEDYEVDNLGVRAALSVLKFYKREISPLLPRSCRFVPTCSEYSMIAYKKYGFVKGTVLTTWRICRCNPLGGSGFDPPRWFNETRPPHQ